LHFAKLNLMQQAQIDRMRSAVVPSQQLLIGGTLAAAVSGGGADITVPLGGFRQSGFGRDEDAYRDLKTAWIAP
jgi:hypothetical protein